MNDDVKNENEKRDETGIEEEEIISDIVMDDGDGEESDINKLKDKLVKVKAELKGCEVEKKEYLDGWQRSKADYVNFKREVVEREKDVQVRATERIMEDLLPVLESMDKARAWVKDLQPIEMQLLTVLKSYGLEQFGLPSEQAGMAGKIFDPSKYESVGTVEVDDKEKENIMIEIVSVGYSLAGKVIKPAKVKIGSLQIAN